MPSVACPTCGGPVVIASTPVPPFCSVRCQSIDLGRWLDEEIGMPFEVDREGRQLQRRIGEEDEDE